MTPVEKIAREGLEKKLFPGCQLAILSRGALSRRLCLGKLGYDGHGGPWGEVEPSTVYDLASLTKPLVGSLLAGLCLESGALELETSLAGLFTRLRGEPAGAITVRELLSHSSGYPEYRRIYERRFGACGLYCRDDLLGDTLSTDLESAPGQEARYSDIGFIVLTAVLEKVLGMRVDQAFARHVSGPLGLSRTFFLPIQGGATKPPVPKSQIAPTSTCPWRGRLIHAEVEDENSWALDGIGAHAGLFSSIEDMEKLFLHLRSVAAGKAGILRTKTLQLLWSRQSVPAGTTWALGWDTPNPVGAAVRSSAGEKFSRNAVGHLGFTGTSLWFDRDRDLSVIFLANRVHPTRESADLKTFRPALHDAAAEG